MTNKDSGTNQSNYLVRPGATVIKSSLTHLSLS